MVYSDLKPDNLVLVRYKNKDIDTTIYKPCYILKFINIGSFTILEEQKKLKLEKD